MVLEERKCPNCGSNDVWEKDGSYVCMNCKTFFDNPNFKKSEHVITSIIRDEAEIERSKHEDKSDRRGVMFAVFVLIYMFVMCMFLYFTTK